MIRSFEEFLRYPGPTFLFRLSDEGLAWVTDRRFKKSNYIEQLCSDHFVKYEDDQLMHYMRWASLSETDILELILGRMIIHHKPVDVPKRLRSASLSVQGIVGEGGKPNKETDHAILLNMTHCWIEDLNLRPQKRRKNEALARSCAVNLPFDEDKTENEYRRLSDNFALDKRLLFEKLYLPPPDKGMKTEENIRRALAALALLDLVDRRYRQPFDEDIELVMDNGNSYDSAEVNTKT